MRRRASPERAAREEVEAQGRAFTSDPSVRRVFDAVPAPFFVVNEHLQVTSANRTLLAIVGAGESQVLGRRAGEVLDCIHSDEAPGGCGLSAACTMCGATSAMLAAIGAQAATRDCRISLKSGDSLDLRVTATPIRVGDAPGALVAAVDISDENRRRTLERIFFHDVLNTAGGVRGLVDVIQEAPPEELDELLGILGETSDRLIDEIQAQRLLAAAEHKDLTVRPGVIHSLAFLQGIARSYTNHEVAAGRRVVVDPAADDAEFRSDDRLLARVVGNLVKNALEACAEHMAVTMGCEADTGSVALWVHNATPMSRAVQLQMFQRSFSTKGGDRGLGTYSVKMLTERYLNGEVSFTSNDREGTTFTVRYPRGLETASA